VALATELQVTLQAGVEIDIGLHRGGVRKTSDLPDVLSVFKSNTDQLTFMGMLGYDGHVTGAPSAPGLEQDTARKVHKSVRETYQSFKDVLHDQFGSLVHDGLIFNSGGTSTFPLFPDDGPVNDVAAGGGMLRPASYDSLFTGALSPASFIASPVLKHFD